MHANVCIRACRRTCASAYPCASRCISQATRRGAPAISLRASWAGPQKVPLLHGGARARRDMATRGAARNAAHS
eukprot:9369408-Pyramimonas_sp.AAC.1